MKIIYIASAACPQAGSEEKIGWNIALESTKTNDVILITKTDRRVKIEEYLSKNNVGNMRVVYVDIPRIYKKIFKGPICSGRANIWHKRALKVAREICENEKIDIIHQITHIEWRSIGDYGSIEGIKFVCGPVGGGEYIPKGLTSYAKGSRHWEFIRKARNKYRRGYYKRSGTLDRCKRLLFVNQETKEFLAGLRKDDGCTQNDCMLETAVDRSEICIERNNIEKENNKRMFLVAGRLNYRKGHSLLLDALDRLPRDLDYECNIVGSGPEEKKLKKKCAKLNLGDKVIFRGSLPFEKMNEAYDSSEVLIMPSIRETSGAVLFEAASRGLAVITMGRFGAAQLFDSKSAFLYDGNSKEEYIENLKNTIELCIKDASAVREKAQNALSVIQKHTWEEQLKIYNSIYKEI